MSRRLATVFLPPAPVTSPELGRAESPSWSVLLGGNSEETCMFPFSYKGRWYTACTMDNSKRPWCATTSHYEADRKWKYCGTADSSPCVFPFIYKGKTYRSCTAVNDQMGRPWCATTPSYDKDHLWRFC
uniref:Fibronectin type-II domain-containing protein n=1 Tax=Gopherus agassizii TaxID=38772 RepID=A0A452GRK9_9SAUR